MVVASQILWSGHRIPILRSHVGLEEPLDVPEVELPGRSPDELSGDRTCFYVLEDLFIRLVIKIQLLFRFLRQMKRIKLKWREDLLHVFFRLMVFIS